MTAGFPQVPLSIKVELLLNDTWTDVSAYVYQRDGISITGGRQDESSSPAPAQAVLTMNNRDGRFSPNYAGGAYSPFLKRNIQLRISVTAQSVTGVAYSGYRFWGTVPEWPPLSDLSGKDVYVPITANGPLRQLNQGGGKGSALTRYYGSLTGSFAPIAYWPAEEDPSNSGIVGAGLAGGTNMAVTGTPTWKAISDFNGSAPLGVLNSSTWDGLTGAFATSGDDIYTAPGTYTWVSPFTGNLTVKVWGGGGGGAGTSGSGSAGTDSSFTGDVVTITGHAGHGGTLLAGGAGGTGSGAPTHFNGGAGALGNTGTAIGGGGGGSGGTAAGGNAGQSGASGGAGATAVAGGGPGGAGGASGPPAAPFPGKSPASGPGGGGGAAGAVGNTPSGGGGGEFSTSTIVAVTAGTSYPVVVGAGGTGGSSNSRGVGASGYAGEVELVYTPTSVPSANVLRFIALVPVHGGNPGHVLVRALTGGTIAKLEVIYQSGGGYQLKGYNGAGTVLFTSSTLSVANGTTHMVSVELTPSGSSVAWALRAINPGSSSLLGSVTGTQATSTLAGVTEVLVAPNGDITKTAVGHISVQYALITLTAVSEALNGHDTEMGVDRFIRLANETALGNLVEYGEAADHWGFETGTQSWTANNGALTNPTTTGVGWPSEGTHSLLMTCSGAGQPAATSPSGTSGLPVVAGDIVTAALEIYAPSGLTNAYMGIKWYTSGGASISQTNSADQVILSATATVLTVKDTAPATAAFFALVFGDHTTDSAGKLIYGDNVRVHPYMGVQSRKELTAFFREIETLDQGLLKEAKDTWGLKYRTRIRLLNQTPVVTLDYSLAHLSDVLSPVVDDQKIKNDVTVKRHRGSKIRVSLETGTMSTSEVGRYKKEMKVVAQDDAQLVALASHLLNLGTVPDERYPTISVSLARTEVASLFAAIPAVEAGDFVELVNLPFWYPDTTAKQLVIGYTETLNAYQWDIVWNCTPESPYEITASSIRRW